MSSPNNNNNNKSPEVPFEDEDDNNIQELPLTMAASVILENLPKDASQALETAGKLEQAKGAVLSCPLLFLSFFLSLPSSPPEILIKKNFAVTIRLSPLPNTPQLKPPSRFKCSSGQRFEYIVRFLRKKLGLKDHESVFCYVNSVFAPGLDEGVGNLWRVSYQ